MKVIFDGPLTPSILMENYDHTICPVGSTLSLYVPVHKAWLLKFIFKVDASS